MERMSEEHRVCRALKWEEETTGICYSERKVSVPLLEEPVEPLKQFFFFFFFFSKQEESLQFLKHIRKHNTCFLMASCCNAMIFTGIYYPRTSQSHNWIPASCVSNHSYGRFISRAMRKQKLKYVVGSFKGPRERREFKTALENIPDESCKAVIHQDSVLCGQH
ncbi:hypothetical protein PR048_010949 [Dryococelus australis]|uniref:Uncharacterized protein n=1 Tax=Dryococelus australis TaxID=614101 RepID=A0ABQ9HLG8_9NEOP|nr:hypothetical protein PR048_010949 [Dryococelus australis]